MENKVPGAAYMPGETWTWTDKPEMIMGKTVVIRQLLLPVINKPEVLETAVSVYGKAAQTDMVIEEMSELTKAILKRRRAKRAADAEECEKAIYEETADVIIMLQQLIMIYGGREEIQEIINSKVDRLAERLDEQKREAARGAAESAAQDVLRPAT